MSENETVAAAGENPVETATETNESAATTEPTPEVAEQTAAKPTSEVAEQKAAEPTPEVAEQKAVEPTTEAAEQKAAEPTTEATTETKEAAAPEPPAAPAPPEEISYHAVENEGEITAIWEMQGQKHLRTIDPRSTEGQKIFSLFTSDIHETDAGAIEAAAS